MRLTEKLNSGGYIIDTKLDYANSVVEMIQKYGQLEDFEDEYGIKLITLLKALNNGIYWIKVLNNFHRKIVFSELVRFCQGYLDCYDKEDHHYTQHINTHGYGRTWALTKEELE